MRRVGRWMGWLGLAGLLVLSPALVAGAEGIVVSSGNQGGYYHALADRLQWIYISRGTGDINVLPSSGSLQNLERLRDPTSPVNVVLVQADALKRFVEISPGFDKEFTVLSDIGKECVFVVAGKSGMKSIAGLKEKDGRALSVVSPESGGAITWDLMSRIEPDFRNTRTVYVNAMRALLQLRKPEFSDLKGLLLVQRPTTVSPPLQIVLDNLDTYRILPIGEGDLGTSKLPDGSEIYTFDDVAIGFGRDHRVKFQTICTRGLLLASTGKLGKKQIDELATVILGSASYIMPERE